MKSVAVLGNGDFFGRSLSVGSALELVCAVLSLAAVVLLPWLGWRALRRRRSDALTAFYVFWSSSAILLALAFLFSAAPVDIGADRYVVGLLYAAAAVVPAAVAGNVRGETAVVVATCVLALGAIVSLAGGATSSGRPIHPPPLTARDAQRIARIAASHHLTVGYSGYWEAAPVTWSTAFRVHVYPVSVCNQGANLCRFDLHFISSWYEPRPHTGSFLLIDDQTSQSVTRPTPDLGHPVAVYRVRKFSLYAYGYDLAAKMKIT